MVAITFFFAAAISVTLHSQSLEALNSKDSWVTSPLTAPFLMPIDTYVISKRSVHLHSSLKRP